MLFIKNESLLFKNILIFEIAFYNIALVDPELAR